MDDDVYVATLLAILTNPEPPDVRPDDPYRQSSDGIDRYNGSEVRVESVSRIPGSYGEDLEVGYVLNVPPDFTEVPPRATTRVRFDPEWRRLSGYAEPAAYAPVVASAVEWAALEHVQRYHERGGRARSRPDPVKSWRTLLDQLEQLWPVTVTGDRSVEVRVDDEMVKVILPPDETFDPPDDLDDLEERFASRPDSASYLVAYDGYLHFSVRAELPPVRPPHHVPPFVSGGAWYAYLPGDGRAP